MKKKLKAYLAKLQARRSALVAKSDASEDLKEVRSLGEQIEEVNGAIAETEAALAELDEEGTTTGETTTDETVSERTAVVTGAPSGVPEIARAGGVSQRQDNHGTLEYRQAFMTYMQTGVMAPELRADTYTGLSDVAAIIPTTISNEVIKKITSYGNVYNKVRKLNVKGGVNIPISSLVPTASWIGSGATDRQKLTLSTSISFNYYGLECKIAIDLIAYTTSLDLFESEMVDAMSQAMAKALDIAVISGTGSTQPTGITVDSRIASTQKIALTTAQFGDWESWAKMVFAKQNKSYKAGAQLFMASGTWESYINGMVDDNGQPIGRVNYGIADGGELKFAGRIVNEVEDDVIEPFDDASTGDVVAVIFNPTDYIINSNMTLTSMRWFDPDTNQWVSKMNLIADGKIADPNGVLIITKAATPTS